MKKECKKITIILLSSLVGLILQIGCEFKGQNVDNSRIEKETNSLNIKLSDVEFESTFIDGGQIKEGEVVEIDFKYKNISDVPFVIQSVKTWCSCSSPKYSKTPLLNNETGLLEILFDSQGRVGINNRSIVVISNSIDKYTKLSFKVEVLKK